MKNSRWHASVALFIFSILFYTPVTSGQTSIDVTLKPYLSQYDLLAIAAAVVKRGVIVSSGAVGTRRSGSTIPVTVNDRFHIGSDTKAMTALLAAIMVEEGKLKWHSTIAEVFPEIADSMDPGVRKVTLEQLLSHTSGMPADNEDFINLLKASFVQDGNLEALRKLASELYRGVK